MLVFACTLSLPGDVAELHGDALRHAPLLRKHAPVLLLVVHQLPLDPGVAPVDFIQPGDLRRRKVGQVFHHINAILCLPHTSCYIWIPTHVLVFLKQHQVLREVLPDELLDDFLFDARVQHVGHQAGVSEHVAGADGSLRANKTVQSPALVPCKAGRSRRRHWERMMTLDPWEGKASSKSARIWVPNSLWAAFTLERITKTNQFSINQISFRHVPGIVFLHQFSKC